MHDGLMGGLNNMLPVVSQAMKAFMTAQWNWVLLKT